MLTATKRVALRERETTAALIALLAELDTRRLYLGEGCSSLFAYCTRVLHFSEHEAYARIAAARVSRRFPVILNLLADGAVNLTTVGLVAPHFTPENHAAVLDAARQKSKREVERLVAALHPQPDHRAIVRCLPASTGARDAAAPTPSTRPPALPSRGTSTVSDRTESPLPSLDLLSSRDRSETSEVVDSPVPSRQALARDPAVVSAPASRSAVVPLAPGRYVVKVTVTETAHANLRRAQDLLRHVIPNGDPAAIIERGLALLVEHLEKTRLATVRRPRPARASDNPPGTRRRRVPAFLNRVVWARDQGRCAFVGTEGRCAETGFLEIHHVVPYAAGGATTADNLSPRCRAHNGHEAALFFGERFPYQPHG